MSRDFALPPLAAATWLTLPGLSLLILASLLLVPDVGRDPSTPMLVTGAALGAILLVTLPALRRRRITLDDDRLQVAATFYTRDISVEALDLEQARIVDLAEYTLLRNRQRAFCLLIGRGRALLLPQHDGKLLLLSPREPQALLDALRAAGPVRAR